MKAGWSEVSLGEVCEFRYGKALKADQRSGSEWPVYGSNGPVGYHHAALTDGPTIVIGRKGSYGEVHYSNGPAWPIDTTYFVDGTCTSCDLRWLSYRLSGLRLTELNRAAAVPGLNRDDAYRKRLLLPPLDEQRWIARLLDKADGVLGLRQRSLECLITLRQALLARMLGSDHDPVVAFGDLLAGPLGNGISPAAAGTHAGAVLTLSALRGGGFNERAQKPCLFAKPPAPRQLVTRGTFLVSRGNGNLHLVGAGAVVPDDLPGVAYPDTMIGARIDHRQVTPEYLEAVWASTTVRDQIERVATTTNGTYKINQTKLAMVEVPLPALEQQAAFSRCAWRITEHWSCVVDHLHGLDALFASLQHRAFSGTL